MPAPLPLPHLHLLCQSSYNSASVWICVLQTLQLERERAGPVAKSPSHPSTPSTSSQERLELARTLPGSPAGELSALESPGFVPVVGLRLGSLGSSQDWTWSHVARLLWPLWTLVCGRGSLDLLQASLRGLIA
jgi:hypothetical protein